MSENSKVLAPIGRVSAVMPHPNSDKLDLITILGYTNVANRPSPDQPRYCVGDLAVVLPENLILPDRLIKHLDMWDHAKNRGGLAGGKGNRTKPRRAADIISEVALCRIAWIEGRVVIEGLDVDHQPVGLSDDTIIPEGYDMADVLGIIPYVAPKT